MWSIASLTVYVSSPTLSECSPASSSGGTGNAACTHILGVSSKILAPYGD